MLEGSRTRQKPKRSATRGASPRTRATDRLTLALASFAHEVRTPLNGILAFSELLLDAKLSAQPHGWAQAMHSAAQHLERLTTAVVDGARAGHSNLVLRREEFSPQQLAADMAAALTARAQVARLPAHSDLAADLPQQVVGDGTRLRAALENLLDNAVKFANGGAVAFAARCDRARDGRIRLTFSIADRGAGLSKRDCAKLFQPFAQVDSVSTRHPGAGLGLFFARNVARAMGGDLVVESTPGKGSTFRLDVLVDLPCAIASESNGATRPRLARAAKTLRILCAEDNAHGQALLRSILGALGHEAIFVDNGEAAITAADAEAFDLALVDLTLPRLDGCAVARCIRTLPGAPRRLPIIGLSGHDDARHMRAAKASGMNAYLAKPVTPRALAAAIAAAVEPSAKRAGKTRRSPTVRSRR
ncbi:MAG: ATP-binding protein [Variibacter sp.]